MLYRVQTCINYEGGQQDCVVDELEFVSTPTWQEVKPDGDDVQLQSDNAGDDTLLIFDFTLVYDGAVLDGNVCVSRLDGQSHGQ
jgi:hypothetical protein